MKECPQCKHPLHPPVKVDGTDECPFIIAVEPLKKVAIITNIVTVITTR